MADEPEILIDARGHRCPVPTLRLRRALEAARPGAALRILADDPMARIDIPHFVVQAGARIESIVGDGATIDILIHKQL
jgi:tRNA 2-thiouridine synthesizing protein A